MIWHSYQTNNGICDPLIALHSISIWHTFVFRIVKNRFIDIHEKYAVLINLLLYFGNIFKCLHLINLMAGIPARCVFLCVLHFHHFLDVCLMLFYS